VVALLRVHAVRIQAEVRHGELERRVVTDVHIVHAQQFRTAAGRWVRREDDVGRVTLVEPGERQFDLAGEVRLRADPAVERNSVHRHGVGRATRVARRGEGQRAEPQRRDPADGGRDDHRH